MVEKSTAIGGGARRTRPSLVNRKAITTVAKTSKKPSTHRCTTHQRQYSAIARLRLASPHQAGAVEQADGDRRA